MKSEPPFSDAAFEAQLCAARKAPLPRFAGRLAIGFGARTEARLRAAIAEAAGVERVLLRWLTAFGACAVLALVAAGAAGLHTANPASPGPDFADAWARSTAPPRLWAQPD
jgi:hypothetical protein